MALNTHEYPAGGVPDLMSTRWPRVLTGVQLYCIQYAAARRKVGGWKGCFDFSTKHDKPFVDTEITVGNTLPHTRT